MSIRVILAGVADLWCGWTHGGGHIQRDPTGRVNWQCNKCGRWAEPVSEEDERRAINADIAASKEREQCSVSR